MKTKTTLFFLGLFLINSFSWSQQLSIEQIMQGPDFVGHLPDDIRWSVDSKTVYFTWNPEQEPLRSLYKTDLKGSTPTKVSTAEKGQIIPQSVTYNKTFSQLVYAKNGDIFLHTPASNTTVQITNTLENESNPSFSNDGKDVIFQKGKNIFIWNITLGTTTQLTDFRSGSKGSDAQQSEEEAWLENDQLSLFQILKERKHKEELAEARSENEKPDRPKTIYLGSKSISSIQLSPDKKHVTYRLATNSGKDKHTDVMDHVINSGFTKNLRSRPKVGFEKTTYEMGIYDIANDTSFIIDIKTIPGIYDKPAYKKEYHSGETTYNDKFESPREVIIHSPTYSPSGRAVVTVRSQDNKDRWIMELVPTTGELKLLDRQRDEAWVGGPGISGWNFYSGSMGWIDDHILWFQSEESGYSHLYTVDLNTGKKKALTKGKYEVLTARLSRDKKHFYLTTNEVSPAEHHFYRLSVKGGKATKITTLTGAHQVSLSPDEKHLAIRYSYSNKPWELYLMSNEAGSTPLQVTHSTTTAFKAYPWKDPELITFTANDGAQVAARLYKPANATPGGPAVIFVHGAGYLQNVHKWWSSYFREYMFHNFLADNGYTVLDIDYRGSAGYGRDWRTGIYRHMGGKDLSDQLDGAKYLAEHHGVDAGKIGIYGGSYGGFITIMALLTSPGTFQAGAALRSVTDWAHYNHGYTSNILNTPVEDSVAFRRSSPIYFAENLQDRLVMLHGMIDTNVQFQDVVRLSQRFIELGKDNWELAVFPMEGHGFVEPSSWTDEYKRIFKLFEETLKE